MSFTINDDVTLTSSASIDNVRISGNTISSTDTDGNIILAPNGAGTVQTDNLQLDGNTISSTNTDGNIVLSPDGAGTVQTDNLQLDGNTISSTDTDGDLMLTPNGNGNVGIANTTPNGKLDIGGNTDGAIQVVLTRGLDTDFQLQAITSSSSSANGAIVSKFGLRHLTNETALFNFIRGGTAADGSIAFITNNSERMRINSSGDIGIGTSGPQAALHVQRVGTGTSVQTYGTRRYFRYDTGLTYAPGTGDAGNQMSIYSRFRIVANDYIISHGSSIFSDRRIKDNIVDVEDDQCLQKIRLLKPKNYTYKDTVAKGSAPVWGFIAQEVSDVLDYAVEKIQQIIPSIYKLASVSEDGYVLTFDDPVSLELMDSIKLQIRTLVHEELDVIVSEIISSTSVRLSEPLSENHHTGLLDDENIVRKVFVYGQYVDDFHILKKDAIFTVAVAALQEVDRRQVDDNERILELENENNTLKVEINTLKQQMALVMQNLGL